MSWVLVLKEEKRPEVRRGGDCDGLQVRKTFFSLAFCECCRRLLFQGQLQSSISQIEHEWIQIAPVLTSITAVSWNSSLIVQWTGGNIYYLKSFVSALFIQTTGSILRMNTNMYRALSSPYALVDFILQMLRKDWAEERKLIIRFLLPHLRIQVPPEVRAQGPKALPAGESTLLLREQLGLWVQVRMQKILAAAMLAGETGMAESMVGIIMPGSSRLDQVATLFPICCLAQ